MEEGLFPMSYYRKIAQKKVIFCEMEMFLLLFVSLIQERK